MSWKKLETKTDPRKMTRGEMQTEALVIESLLSTAMAYFSSKNPEEMMTIIEMAHERARKLNEALDSINAPETV